MNYLNIAQILISVFIILIILLQVRDSGGGIFGGGQGTIRTRRGLEKVLFQFTWLEAFGRVPGKEMFPDYPVRSSKIPVRFQKPMWAHRSIRIS